MNIVWEKNSRVLALAADGKIDYKDIIDRTTTDNFPAGTATVRMQGLNEKQPHTVLHIRGKSKQKPYRMISGTFQCATTCRVTLDNAWKGYGMSSNLSLIHI